METKALHLENGVKCYLGQGTRESWSIYTPIPMLLRVALEVHQWPGASGLWYEPAKHVPAAQHYRYWPFQIKLTCTEMVNG